MEIGNLCGDNLLNLEFFLNGTLIEFMKRNCSFNCVKLIGCKRKKKNKESSVLDL